MASFARRMCTQTATYWAPLNTYSKYGDPAFAAPIAVTVRWEGKEIETITTKTGDQQSLKSIVYSDSQEFAVGGFLYLGTSVAANPNTVSGANIILDTDSCIGAFGKGTLYKAVL